jgi:hypothetical protein
MNLIAAHDAPMLVKLGYFGLVLVPTIALTAYSILKSKRLADFLEALADERLSARTKLGALAKVWGSPDPHRDRVSGSQERRRRQRSRPR